MPCDDSLLACQLGRIADSLEPAFDWNAFTANFLGTIIATAIGAGLAFAAALLVYQRQRNDEAERRLNAALAMVLQKLSQDIGAIYAFEKDIADFLERHPLDGKAPPINRIWKKHQPDLVATRGLVMAALLEARSENQRRAVNGIAAVVNVAHSLPAARSAKELLEGVFRLIADWRAGDIDDASVSQRARDIAGPVRERLTWFDWDSVPKFP